MHKLVIGTFPPAAHHAEYYLLIRQDVKTNLREARYASIAENLDLLIEIGYAANNRAIEIATIDDSECCGFDDMGRAIHPDGAGEEEKAFVRRRTQTKNAAKKPLFGKFAPNNEELADFCTALDKAAQAHGYAVEIRDTDGQKAVWLIAAA